VTGSISLADVLGTPVCVAGTRVGVVADVYADRAAEHVVGVEVVGPADRRWYLPWAAAIMDDGALTAASPLVLMSLDQARFYVERGIRLEPRDVDGMTIGGAGALVRPEPGLPAEREGTGVA
jgi:PRC-barrel domain